MKKTFIIAEAGVNHNGSLENAIHLINIAHDSGADAVKFQTFRSNSLVSKFAPKAEYQTKTTDATETQIEMLRKLELNEFAHEKLIQHANSIGIEFLSTPFDLESLELLTKKFKLKKIKIPSGEITNAPFLLEIAKVSEKIILSTGMSTISDIEFALSVIAFGFLGTNKSPSPENFSEAFYSNEGQRELRSRVIILHATTEYPAPFDEVNLSAIDTIYSAFRIPVGYSDHTQGIHIPIAAVAKGAVIIEKHFTIDRNLPGPDHKASLEPNELKQMIQTIRDVEKALGNGLKIPTASEIKNRKIARKSLVAIKDIQIGEVFSIQNLGVKRPGNGKSPTHFWEYIGKRSDKNYESDELIS
jgi:2,4-diacetamido-2,4,6-trideoxy-beta-L-gulose transferase